MTALLLGVGTTTNDFTTTSDTQGQYVFSGMPTGHYQLYVSPPSGYGITSKGAGNDRTVDSDLALFSYFPPSSGRTAVFEFNGMAITNLDAGFLTLHSGMSAQTALHGISDKPLFATNGTVVSRSCILSNSGETALSFVSVYDQTLDEMLATVDCPGLIAEGGTIAFTNTFVVTASTTNRLSLMAVPINPVTCETLDLDVLFTTTQNVVIVVDPGSPNDHDGDGSSDWEEFITGTDGADPGSRWALELAPDAVTITPSATSRIYRILATTNLADGSSWRALGEERPGSGGLLSFAITNLSGSAVYRASARIP